jgi:hypothetical protein
MSRSRQELGILPVGVGESRTIKLPDGFDRYQSGQWLPDGRLLIIALEHGHDPKVYVQQIGGAPRAISPEGLLPPPVISADGRRILVSINQKAMVLTVDGADAQPVSAIEPGETPIAWSRDGQSALVTSSRDDMAETVNRINLKTGVRTAWKVLAPGESRRRRGALQHPSQCRREVVRLLLHTSTGRAVPGGRAALTPNRASDRQTHSVRRSRR